MTITPEMREAALLPATHVPPVPAERGSVVVIGPKVKLIKDANTAKEVMAADALLYWTVCPVPADDGEWYESHWHPCTCIHYNSEEDLQRMCDQKLLGVVVYD